MIYYCHECDTMKDDDYDLGMPDPRDSDLSICMDCAEKLEQLYPDVFAWIFYEACEKQGGRNERL